MPLIETQGNIRKKHYLYELRSIFDQGMVTRLAAALKKAQQTT